MMKDGGLSQRDIEKMLVLFDQPETEQSWGQFEKELKKINNNASNNFYSSSDIAMFLKQAKKSICNYLLSDRSRLSGAACELIETLVKQTGNAFAPFLETFVPALIKLTGRAHKLFNTRGHTTMKTILASLPCESQLPTFCRAIRGPSKSTRICAIEYINTILDDTEDAHTQLSSYCDILESTLKEAAGDPTAEVRQTARSIIERYISLFPERQKFVDELDATVKRQLHAASVAPVPRPPLVRAQSAIEITTHRIPAIAAITTTVVAPSIPLLPSKSSSSLLLFNIDSNQYRPQHTTESVTPHFFSRYHTLEQEQNNRQRSAFNGNVGNHAGNPSYRYFPAEFRDSGTDSSSSKVQPHPMSLSLASATRIMNSLPVQKDPSTSKLGTPAQNLGQQKAASNNAINNMLSLTSMMSISADRKEISNTKVRTPSPDLQPANKLVEKDVIQSAPPTTAPKSTSEHPLDDIVPSTEIAASAEPTVETLRKPQSTLLLKSQRVISLARKPVKPSVLASATTREPQPPHASDKIITQQLLAQTKNSDWSERCTAFTKISDLLLEHDAHVKPNKQYQLLLDTLLTTGLSDNHQKPLLIALLATQCLAKLPGVFSNVDQVELLVCRLFAIQHHPQHKTKKVLCQTASNILEELKKSETLFAACYNMVGKPEAATNPKIRLSALTTIRTLFPIFSNPYFDRNGLRYSVIKLHSVLQDSDATIKKELKAVLTLMHSFKEDEFSAGLISLSASDRTAARSLMNDSVKN